MDGVSIAASIAGIATAGIQVSIKLVTLAGQISAASDRIGSVGNDVSLTCNILHQLEDLMKQKTPKGGLSIFSKGGLETVRTSAEVCQKIFRELEGEAAKASKMIKGRKRLIGEKIKLSLMEKAKWPFLQPSLEVLRVDLREAKGTLMLMLQAKTLLVV